MENRERLMNIWNALLNSSRFIHDRTKRGQHRYEWLNVLADDIEDCERTIAKAKQQLAILISERLQLEIDMYKIEGKVLTLEKLAMTALQSSNNGDAMESALKIAFYEAQAKGIKNRHARVHSEEQYISRNLQEDIQVVRLLKQELNRSRGNHDTTSAKKNADKVIEIQETLCRIKSTQLWNANHMETRQQLKNNIDNDAQDSLLVNNGSTLGEGLAHKVLKRIREKHLVSI